MATSIISNSLRRPNPWTGALPLLSSETHRLEQFQPPFQFTSFFSPEDTLLCAIAAEHALAHWRRTAVARAQPRIAELTSGSGLVGLHLLAEEPAACLLGIDIDPRAAPIATANAAQLGMAERAEFRTGSIWDSDVAVAVRDFAPDLLLCNPPYIPEPPCRALPVEAGSGADGAAHLHRVLALAQDIAAASLTLSWCSLCDPVAVARHAEEAGYIMDVLCVTIIADGEYSGSVHDYLRTLPTAYLCEREATLAAVSTTGSARFGYLLLAASFHRADKATATRNDAGSRAVSTLVASFADNGVSALSSLALPVPTHCWALDHWDEVLLRGYLHGPLA